MSIARSTSLVLGGVLLLSLVACETSPAPYVRERFVEAPAEEAPPSKDELATDGPSDVVVPDLFGGEASSDESKMGIGADMGPVVVYLNREGGTYAPGADDASRRVASVLSYYRRGASYLPPSGYSAADWQALVSCVRAQFVPYNIVVTDQRPQDPSYSELAVTNTWAANVLGISNGVGGIAPLGQCRVIGRAVGFVFQPIYDQPGYGGVRGTCEAVAHEIGHTLSLSHERLASDLMSYAPTNPAKRFQNGASACGTSAQAPEACTCGAATQNSHQQLLSLVGPNSGQVPGGGGGGGASDTTAPTVSLVSPAPGALPGNSEIEIVVRAQDNVGLAKVRLVWQFTQRELACDDTVSDATCTRSGDLYKWKLRVGTGSRSFFAYAVDAAGNKAQTPMTTIDLGASGGMPATDLPPTITPTLPAANQSFRAGEEIVFQARVADDAGIVDVRAVWFYNGGSLEYPMAETTTPGVYQAKTTVSATASAGWRSVELQAVDTKGQRTRAPRRDVYVR